MGHPFCGRKCPFRSAESPRGVERATRRRKLCANGETSSQQEGGIRDDKRKIYISYETGKWDGRFVILNPICRGGPAKRSTTKYSGRYIKAETTQNTPAPSPKNPHGGLLKIQPLDRLDESPRDSVHWESFDYDWALTDGRATC